MRSLVGPLAALVLAGCLSTSGPASLPTPAAGGFSDTSVFAGAYDTTDGIGKTLQPGPYKPLPAEVVELPSAVDGSIMQIGLVRPDVPDGMRVPVIAQASPYFEPLLRDNVANQGFYGVTRFLPHGYAIALIAVRGTAGNSGCMEYFGPNERADLSQAITWLGEQPWSSGAVGMWGGSYDGGTQWQAASTGNSYLKTIVPLAGVADPFTLLFQNGTAANRGVWHPLSYWLSPGPTSLPNTPVDGKPADRMPGWATCSAARDATLEALDAAQRGERTPFWQVRDPRPGLLADYTGSVFVVQGLQDFNVLPSQPYPFAGALEQRITVKHLLGQWMHMLPDQQTGPDLERLTYYGFPYILGSRLLDYALKPNPHVRWDGTEILLHWYDYWLKGDRSVDLGPRAQVEDSSGRWRDESTWPPRDAQPRSLWLTGPGGLSERPGAEGSKLAGPSPVHLLSPIHVEDVGLQAACASCAIYESEPLAAEMRVSGLPQLRLTVTPQGPGGQVYAYLYAVEAGKSWRVTLGSVDLRVADGSEAPKDVQPGQPMQAVVQLEPCDAVLPAGARLQLVVAHGSQSDHATAAEVPFAPAFPYHVEAGGEKSALTLPVIERGPDAFFEPPR